MQNKINTIFNVNLKSALWLMPRQSVYGEWPRFLYKNLKFFKTAFNLHFHFLRSGEIDLMESRGNRDLWGGDVHVGTQQVGSTLHYGPIWYLNGWGYTHKVVNNPNGYDNNFHLYKMVWTTTALEFFVDNVHLATFDAGEGFWYRGNFGNEFENIWAHNPMGPFDQEFFIQINNAIGGTGFFSDYFDNRSGGQKPWENTDPCHHRSFWYAKIF